MPGCTTCARRVGRCDRHRLSPTPTDPGPSSLSDHQHSTATSPAMSQAPIVPCDRESPRGDVTAVRGVYLTPEQRMQALTKISQYSGPSWPDIRDVMDRANHAQPRLVAAMQLPTHATPTLVTASIEDDHLIVGGFGIQVSDRPAS